jgi:hypothetical protein
VNATSNLAGLESECGNLTLVTADPCKNRVIAGVAKRGLYATSDRGATWNKLSSAPGSANIVHRPSSIVFDPEHHDVIYESGIYGALNDGDSSSVVTFTFSEAPVGFDASDIVALNGTVTGLTATGNPLVYTATFTADDGFTGTGSVTVDAAKFTDAALNTNVAATPATVTIDTQNPTVTVAFVASALSDTTNASVVNFALASRVFSVGQTIRFSSSRHFGATSSASR